MGSYGNISSMIEFERAVHANSDRWVPACGGSELPFRFKGRRFLYCFNPARYEHAYYDMDRDLVISDEEAADIGLLS